MNTELRKRLEEAANGIYPISEIYNDLAMEFVDTNSGLREAFKDGGEVGIELGYKEAIALAREWLMEHINTDVECNKNGEPLAISYIEGRKLAIKITEVFEADMNKLWED